MFDNDILQEILKTALSRGGDYADIFLEETRDTKLSLDNGKVKTVNTGLIYGAGIRVISGTNYTYFHTGNPDSESLKMLAREIATAVSSGKKGIVHELKGVTRENLNPIKTYPESVPLSSKVEMLKRGDAAAREYSSKITEVMLSYWDNDQAVTVATSDGIFMQDRRTRTRFVVVPIAQDGERKERGMFGPGRSMGFEFFDLYNPEEIAQEAARISCVLLEADFAPQGKMPVVINNGFGGVIFHEACGHALEATAVARNASVFCNKLNQKIASDIVTAIDDGTLRNEWGSSNFDDEGSKTRKNVLIENGILKSYMVDKLGSIRMDHPITGSARRQSYKFTPTSRMTNTYITPGESTTSEMVSSIDYGLYCRNMGGGSVNPPTTDFNFAVSEAYLIENGKITKPVKGASLIGKGSEIIQNIEMIADNLGHGTGMCGSLSGSIPANVGQPAIKVSGLVVGGRE